VLFHDREDAAGILQRFVPEGFAVPVGLEFPGMLVVLAEPVAVFVEKPGEQAVEIHRAFKVVHNQGGGIGVMNHVILVVQVVVHDVGHQAAVKRDVGPAADGCVEIGLGG
jgi:hypothetical protein